MEDHKKQRDWYVFLLYISSVSQVVILADLSICTEVNN